MTKSLIHRVCLMSALLVAYRAANAAAPVDWERLQAKFESYPPNGLPALTSEFYRRNQSWPTNVADLLLFEARAFGASNAVSWSQVGAVTLTPRDDGTLTMIWEQQEDGTTVNGAIALSPTVPDPLDVKRYFAKWRSADIFSRGDMIDVSIVTPVIAGEESNTVENILGPPDEYFAEMEDLKGIGFAWIYNTKDRMWMHEPQLVDGKVRVIFDTDAKCMGAEGRIR